MTKALVAVTLLSAIAAAARELPMGTHIIRAKPGGSRRGDRTLLQSGGGLYQCDYNYHTDRWTLYNTPTKHCKATSAPRPQAWQQTGMMSR